MGSGWLNRFRINFRNHRKIVVVDGAVSWVGGHNVGDEYLGKGRRFDFWRDTHVKMEGPVTLAVQLCLPRTGIGPAGVFRIFPGIRQPASAVNRSYAFPQGPGIWWKAVH